MNIKDKFRMSIPKKGIIHGVEVKKLPIGKYLDAIDAIKNIPEILMKNSFPGMNSDQIIGKFKNIDENMFFELITSLIKTVPEQGLRFIGTLIDVSYEKLRNEISPKELSDILQEFWKVNDMSDFFKDIVKVVKKNPLIQDLMNGGSKT